MIPGKTRIDKWLWAVRLFKTRSLAADACEKGKVRIAQQAIKASRIIKVSDVVSIRNGAFTLQYEVLQLTSYRMAAKLVSEFYRDITRPETIEKMRMQALEIRSLHHQGEGRPTKKDRRALDDFIS